MPISLADGPGFTSLACRAGAIMGFQQEYVLASRACRQHHALGYSKAHLPGRQVCHDDRELAHQVFRLIGAP